LKGVSFVVDFGVCGRPTRFEAPLLPRPLNIFQPPLQASEQDFVGGLDLSIRLRMLYRGEHLLGAELCAQLAQLLACELGVVVRH